MSFAILWASATVLQTGGWQLGSSVETVSLANSGVTLTGPHDCLMDADGTEEVHLEKQRELRRAPPFRTCVP